MFLSRIDAAGLKADDKDAILELVMEVSGAHEIVKDAFKILSTKETSQVESIQQHPSVDVFIVDGGC